MHPTWMLTMLVGLFAAFGWSETPRWQLLKVGTTPAERLDRIGERLKGTYEYAFVQKKMAYYRAAGLAQEAVARLAHAVSLAGDGDLHFPGRR